MIRFTPYLSALVALLTVFFYAAPQGNVEDVSLGDASIQTIELPLEVMHYDVFGEHEGNSELPMYGSDSPRYVESVTFDVSGDPGDLWVWGHQIGFQYFWDYFDWQQGQGDYLRAINSSYDAPYDGRAKAAIRINGGAWVDVNNDNVTCQEVEEALGCIGGASNAQRFRVENTASMLQSGSNTIEFAFLGHDMLSSGFRVLDFVVLPSGYTGTLSHRDVRPVDLITNNKILDYLDTEAPAGSDPVQGQALWEARNSLIDWPGGPDVIASCNDCHAQDGRDLEFFGYSNNSIVVRSMHHGLTQQEGENIAAYIRSQDLLDEDGVAYAPPGRPWNPPYQPGPRGFGPNDEHPDVAPQQYWSAGAGLDWVADRELDVYPYALPDGTADHDAGPFVQSGGISVTSDKFDFLNGRTNAREVPSSIQFPDWNKWLPIIHPLDTFGESEWLNTTAVQRYEEARQDPSNFNIGRAIGRIDIDVGGQGGLDVLGAQTQWNRNTRFGEIVERANRGGKQFGAVKAWELHHEFHKEGHTGSAAETFEPRGWVTTAGPVFRVAAHIGGGSFRRTDGLPNFKSDVLSHHWYQAQLVISGANRNGDGGRPMDWNYQDSFLGAHDDETGLNSGTRWILSRNILHQLIYQYGVDDAGDNHMLSQNRHGLREVYSAFAVQQGLSDLNAFGDLDTGTETKILNQYLSGWAKMYYTFPWEDFKRCPGGACDSGGDRNYWGLPEDRPEVQNPTTHGQNQANNHYNSMRVMNAEWDLASTTIDSLARMGDALWSEAQDGSPEWSTWFVENTPAFSLIMTGSGTQTEPGNVALSAEPAETPDEVRFYQDNVLISTQTSAPFEYDVSGLSAGTYSFRAEAQTGVDIINSGTKTLVVEEAWNRSRLTARSRGDVTGTLNLLPENIQLEATGTDSGLRPKATPQQFEAADGCEIGETWAFSLSDVTGQTGSWSRAGVQIENVDSDGIAQWSMEYLPLQRRVRIMRALPYEQSVLQQEFYLGVDMPFAGEIEITQVGDDSRIDLLVDTTGDGVLNEESRVALWDNSLQNCEISLVATSRRSGQQIEALFTLEKVE